MRTATLSKTVAAITLLSLIVQPRALIILPLLERGGVGNLIALMLLAILALAIASIVGLWRCRWWGFLAFYSYAVSSTLLLGGALIPFVVRLLPNDARTAGVVGINAVALFAVAFLQWRHARQPSGAQ